VSAEQLTTQAQPQNLQQQLNFVKLVQLRLFHQQLLGLGHVLTPQTEAELIIVLPALMVPAEQLTEQILQKLQLQLLLFVRQAQLLLLQLSVLHNGRGHALEMEE